MDRHDQITRLAGVGITTLAQLGSARDDVEVPRIATVTLEKLRDQAALQLHYRLSGEHAWRVLEPETERGLGLLLERSAAAGGSPLVCVRFRTVAENRGEVRWIRELYPERAGYLDVYDHYGQLGPRAIYGHGIWLTEAELQRCHDTGTALELWEPLPGADFAEQLDGRREAGGVAVQRAEVTAARLGQAVEAVVAREQRIVLVQRGLAFEQRGGRALAGPREAQLRFCLVEALE